MTATNLTNFHAIQVKYLGPTNTKGNRIKLMSSRFDESITLERDGSIEARDQAIKYLLDKGFELIGACENGDLIITSAFKGLKND